jgi:hypothetical protein
MSSLNRRWDRHDERKMKVEREKAKQSLIKRLYEEQEMGWRGSGSSRLSSLLAWFQCCSLCVRVCVSVSEIERGRWRDKGRETESQGAEVGEGRESPRACTCTHTNSLPKLLIQH